MHLLCSNSLLFTLYSFSLPRIRCEGDYYSFGLCLVVLYCSCFFVDIFFGTHMRCDVTGCLRELVSGEVGGGGVHKKVLCGEAPRRTPLTFIYNF